MQNTIETLLQALLTVPQSGIAAFVNPIDKRVLLIQSVNLVHAIAKVASEIQMGMSPLSLDRNKLTLVICEECGNDFNSQLVKIRKYRDIYISNGYSLYRPINGVKYRLRVYPDSDGTAIVIAVNKRNRGRTIGAFRDAQQAANWIESTFPDPEYIIPQYADNTLTKLYLEKFDE